MSHSSTVYRRRRIAALAAVARGRRGRVRGHPAHRLRRRRAAARAGRAAQATPTPEAAARAAPRRPPILPDFRVVAYYGAPQDRQLGALGIGTPAQAARKLERQAEPYDRKSRPVLPAMELIAVVAAAHPGEDGRYNLRQPDSVIRRYLTAARSAKALLILDVQPGRSDFFTETRRLRKWLKEPDVGLALDPEWRMGPDEVPGQGDRPRRARARSTRPRPGSTAWSSATTCRRSCCSSTSSRTTWFRRPRAQEPARPRSTSPRRRLRHADAEGRQVQEFRQPGEALPARVQALLRGGPGHDDAGRGHAAPARDPT